ncbi:MAG: hypothetical protein LH614_09565 [Pyrinomonadaceae bacterium]|nr:hypothetical protein [Pyrinomonadaceae bacterium]
MRKLIFTFLCLSLAIGFGATSIFAQKDVGYVLDIEGNWVLNGSNALSQGEKLPAAGSIRPNSSSRYNRIVIADLRGEVLISRNCAVDNCSRAFSLPRQPPPSSMLNTAFDAVMELIWGSPNRYSTHRSRGGELSDGVLKLSGDKVDFSSVLKIETEQYLRWKAISQNKDDSPTWSPPIKLAKAPTVSASDFKPGLYAFELMRRMGGNYETTSSAWILIADEANYEKNRASFQEAKELAEKWGEKVKPETAKIYLQAKLDDLARQTVK